jgi:hypothetical protein
MKSIPLTAWLVLSMSIGSVAVVSAEDGGALRMTDAGWVKDAGDRLARCAGTYRGAAELMRHEGREQAASFAESVGSGALFAAYLLLTSPVAVEAKVLDTVDAHVHIEALAWGAKRNFIMMDQQGDPALTAVFRSCTEASELQSSVLRSSSAWPATAAALPAP